jgi:hypothetical protein
MRRTSGVTVEALEVVSSAIKIPLILGGGSGRRPRLACRASGSGRLNTLLRSRLRILAHGVQYRLNIRHQLSKPVPHQFDGIVCRFRFSAAGETP